MEDFAKQRDRLIEAMLTEKRGQVFTDYLAATRQQMEAKKQIQIFPDALAKLDELIDSSPSQMPQLPPGFEMPPPQ